MDNTVFDDIICGGDFNWHKGRETGFASTVDGFIERLGLVSVWDHFEVDFTHIHTDLKSVSTLDHFLVNKRLIEHIECSPFHLGDNSSRHSPIMLKLKVANIPRSTPVTMDQPSRPAWYKVRKIEVDNYTRLLDEKLHGINAPACLECRNVHCQDYSHTEQRDSYVMNLLTAIIESSHAALPMTGKPRKNNPDKDCPVNQAIPGWKESVKPQRDSAQ